MTMLHDNKPPLDEDLLIHFGVKGMKWGVRKTNESGAVRKRTPEEKKALARNVAIGTGVLLAAVGAAYLAKNSDAFSKVSVSELSKPSASVKKTVDKLAEQTDIIHASRTKSRGFSFIKSGGLHDPLSEYENAFGQDNMSQGIKRLADGRVAAAFHDFEGRTDKAGRVIPHQVLIPKSMADGIHTLDDVKEKIWPQLKDSYDSLYDRPAYDSTSRQS